jgi:hypothetical protein
VRKVGDLLQEQLRYDYEEAQRQVEREDNIRTVESELCKQPLETALWNQRAEELQGMMSIRIEQAQLLDAILKKFNKIPKKKTKDHWQEAAESLIASLTINQPVTAKLFPFQRRAALHLFWNFIHHKHRANLLQAGVGVGKTFILGQC